MEELPDGSREAPPWHVEVVIDRHDLSLDEAFNAAAGQPAIGSGAFVCTGSAGGRDREYAYATEAEAHAALAALRRATQDRGA